METDKEYHLGRLALWFFMLSRSAPFIFILLVSLWAKSQADIVLGAIRPLVREPGLAIDTYRYYGVIVGAVYSLSILGAIVSAAWGWLEHHFYRFVLGPDAFHIRHGVLHKREMTVTYDQIQTVDIQRSLLFLILGLSRLVVLSAGHENVHNPEAQAEGILPILDKTVAEKLRTELAKRSNP